MKTARTTSRSVLFVCLGNICRSPTAQSVFEAQLAQSPLLGLVQVDSAGTAAYHLGKSPDSRSQAAAKKRGYRLEHLRARQVNRADFDQFDYIVAMDSANLVQLHALAPENTRATLALFLEFAPQTDVSEIPDPYFGDEDGFETVLDLCEQAGEGLLSHLQSAST